MNASETKWVRVTPRESIPLREGRCVEIAGRQIAIFHSQGGFFAAENRCPHRGGPLADGIVSGTTVVCPLHAWKFSLHDGSSPNHPESDACLTKYRARIEDGVVCIELPDDAAGESRTIVGEHRDRPLRWVHRKPIVDSQRRKSGGEAGDRTLGVQELPPSNTGENDGARQEL